MFPQAARISRAQPTGRQLAGGRQCHCARRQTTVRILCATATRRGLGLGLGTALVRLSSKSRFEAAQKQSRTRPRKGCSWNISSVSILGT